MYKYLPSQHDARYINISVELELLANDSKVFPILSFGLFPRFSGRPFSEDTGLL